MVKVYRRRNASIAAVQYEPDRGITEFADFVAKYCVEMSIAIQDDVIKAVVKLTDNSWVHVFPGSWLVRLEDGRVCVCNDDYFREGFEVV
jgi:hypothetical protein